MTAKRVAAIRRRAQQSGQAAPGHSGGCKARSAGRSPPGAGRPAPQRAAGRPAACAAPGARSRRASSARVNAGADQIIGAKVEGHGRRCRIRLGCTRQIAAWRLSPPAAQVRHQPQPALPPPRSAVDQEDIRPGTARLGKGLRRARQHQHVRAEQAGSAPPHRRPPDRSDDQRDAARAVRKPPALRPAHGAQRCRGRAALPHRRGRAAGRAAAPAASVVDGLCQHIVRPGPTPQPLPRDRAEAMTITGMSRVRGSPPQPRRTSARPCRAALGPAGSGRAVARVQAQAAPPRLPQTASHSAPAARLHLQNDAIRRHVIRDEYPARHVPTCPLYPA